MEFIEKIKTEIQKQRVSIIMNANAGMICLYWNMGRAILAKQEEEGWGTKVIDRYIINGQTKNGGKVHMVCW